LFGCKTVEIKSANKQKVVSGRPNGVSGTTFSVTLKVNNSIKIDSISVGNEVKSYAYNNFELYNLNNGKILQPNQSIKSGEYYINIFSTIKFSNSENEGFIYYTEKGKLRVTETTFQIKDALLMKSSMK